METQGETTPAVCVSVSAGNTFAPMETETLASLRTMRGKSQQWLAKRIGVSPSMISQYENGRSPPSLKRFALMAEELDVSPKRLLRALENAERIAREKDMPPP